MTELQGKQICSCQRKKNEQVGLVTIDFIVTCGADTGIFL